MRRLLVAAAVASSVSATPAIALAGPTETYGFMSRSTAMGGAVSADVSDSSANFYNPAGLVAAKGLTLDIGYVRADPQLRINGRDSQVDAMHGIVFGLIAPGKIAGMPFAFGMGLHLPDDRIFRVLSLEQSQPQWALYDNSPQRIYLSANIAIAPAPWLEIGGGMTFLASTAASLEITGRLDLADPNSSQLRHEVDASLASIRYPEFGVRVRANDRLRFAAVYRGQFQLDLDIAATLNVSANAIGIPISYLAQIMATSVDDFLPQQVVVGGSYDATDNVTIDADVTWIQWSAYKSPVTDVTATTSLTAPAGFPSSFLPVSPAPTVIAPPDFHDRVVPRVGVEWRIPIGEAALGHLLSLRAGYFYERSPVPAQSTVTNFVDTDRHALSIGAGIKLHRPVTLLPGDVRLDVHAQLSLLPDRTFTKSSAADLIGDYRAGGNIVSAGVTLGVVL